MKKHVIRFASLAVVAVGLFASPTAKANDCETMVVIGAYACYNNCCTGESFCYNWKTLL